MTSVIVSPNMNLPVPVVGVEVGPDWASDINACMAAIDSHDHGTGQGVQITPDGINISSDLPMNGNNLTTTRTVRFASQAAALSAVTDIGCIYAVSDDLYYNDGSGNQVRITQGGSVTGSSGTITGLPSGTASASFAASTFTFRSATNTPANMAVGPLAIGSNTVSSKTVTISPPVTLAANYAITFPGALPAATSLVTLDTSGNLASTTSPTLTGGALSGTFTGTPTFSGAVVFSGTPSVTNGAALAGTVSGSPTFSGGPTFSGNPSFTSSPVFYGAATFSGNPVFQGTPLFNGVPNISNGASLAGTMTGSPTFSGNPTFSGTPVFTGSPNIGSGATMNGTVAGTPTFSGLTQFTSGIASGGGGNASSVVKMAVFSGSLGNTSATLTVSAATTILGSTGTWSNGSTGFPVYYTTVTSGIYFSGTSTLPNTVQITGAGGTHTYNIIVFWQ